MKCTTVLLYQSLTCCRPSWCVFVPYILHIFFVLLVPFVFCLQLTTAADVCGCSTTHGTITFVAGSPSERTISIPNRCGSWYNFPPVTGAAAAVSLTSRACGVYKYEKETTSFPACRVCDVYYLTMLFLSATDVSIHHGVPALCAACLIKAQPGHLTTAGTFGARACPRRAATARPTALFM